MIRREVARIYAQAMVEIAQKENRLDTFSGNWDEIEQILYDNSSLDKVIAHPTVTLVSKIKIIRTVFKKCEVEMINLLCLLAKKRRWAYWPVIKDVYEDMAIEAKGFVKVNLETAQSLSDAEYEEIEEVLTQSANRSILLQKSINEKLLGGARIRIKDRVFDGSLASRLTALQKQLTKDI